MLMECCSLNRMGYVLNGKTMFISVSIDVRSRESHHQVSEQRGIHILPTLPDSVIKALDSVHYLTEQGGGVGISAIINPV